MTSSIFAMIPSSPFCDVTFAACSSSQRLLCSAVGSALMPCGRRVIDEPAISRPDSVLERDSRLPAELRELRDVHELARSAVGLRAVELDAALETDDVPHELGELRD